MTDFDQMTNYANYIKDDPFRGGHFPVVEEALESSSPSHPPRNDLGNNADVARLNRNRACPDLNTRDPRLPPLDSESPPRSDGTATGPSAVLHR
jgi:hypothetical protein